jgi:hypothetical protein
LWDGHLWSAPGKQNCENAKDGKTEGKWPCEGEHPYNAAMHDAAMYDYFRDARKRNVLIDALLYQYRSRLEKKPEGELFNIVRKRSLENAHLTQVLELSHTPTTEEMIEVLVEDRKELLDRQTMQELVGMLDFGEIEF